MSKNAGEEVIRAARKRGPKSIHGKPRQLIALVMETAKLPGVTAVAEVGVLRGGTAFLIMEAMKAAGRVHRTYLYDTFAGMPEGAEVDYQGAGAHANRAGRWSGEGVDLETVRSFFRPEDPIEWRLGVFPESIQEPEKTETFGFVHVDCDLHDPILAACQFFVPRLAEDGAIFFDDYGSKTTPGAAVAVDTYVRQLADRSVKLTKFKGYGAILRVP